MSIARLIEELVATGAPIDAIVIAVRAVEEGQAVEAERRARATERKRQQRERERDRTRDGHATVAGQSSDTPRPPSFPHTPKHPPISPQTTPDEAHDAAFEPMSASMPTSGPTREPTSEPDGATLARELNDAGGRALAQPASSPGLLVLSEPINWLRNGCDLRADILPTIQARCSRAKPSSIRSWSYFTEAVYQARDNRLKPAPEPNIAQSARASRSTGRPAAARPHDALLAAFARRAGAHLAARGGSEPEPDPEPGVDPGRTIDLVATGR
ncbi:hypothetical protein CXZ10_13070 [Pleomorphomonas diazotrophica]|uniref:Uncharacterized protein n=1 Tax=Pleomorphomonas diazotrophica TaxID=1166257 RepID=A0A1I4WCF7_9HYPH|nr:hypothetical protein [Pleomorphomonas diazotrophica]PKR89029.1 hypothetical protein CXZ10_13070 [Pleomorphomonas diazotrophica]SFN10926.1 hypothetical protein SAMN05192571_11617 [Pleomorphomonas diazotrophica]